MTRTELQDKIKVYETNIKVLKEMFKMYDTTTEGLNGAFWSDMRDEINTQIEHCDSCIKNLKVCIIENLTKHTASLKKRHPVVNDTHKHIIKKETKIKELGLTLDVDNTIPIHKDIVYIPQTIEVIVNGLTRTIKTFIPSQNSPQIDFIKIEKCEYAAYIHGYLIGIVSKIEGASCSYWNLLKINPFGISTNRASCSSKDMGGWNSWDCNRAATLWQYFEEFITKPWEFELPKVDTLSINEK